MEGVAVHNFSQSYCTQLIGCWHDYVVCLSVCLSVRPWQFALWLKGVSVLFSSALWLKLNDTSIHYILQQTWLNKWIGSAARNMILQTSNAQTDPPHRPYSWNSPPPQFPCEQCELLIYWAVLNTILFQKQTQYDRLSQQQLRKPCVSYSGRLSRCMRS